MRSDNPKLLLDDTSPPQHPQHKHPFAPIRIVLDGGLTIPLESKLVQTLDQAPLWILTRASEEASDKGTALKNSGVRLIPIPAISKQGGGVRLSLPHALSTLAQEGIASILCEGGAKLAHALLHENCSENFLESLVDQLILFSAPHALGAQGRSMFEGTDAASYAQNITFQLEESISLGDDEVRTFRIQKNNYVENNHV